MKLAVSITLHKHSELCEERESFHYVDTKDVLAVIRFRSIAMPTCVSVGLSIASGVPILEPVLQLGLNSEVSPRHWFAECHIELLALVARPPRIMPVTTYYVSHSIS